MVSEVFLLVNTLMLTNIPLGMRKILFFKNKDIYLSLIQQSKIVFPYFLYIFWGWGRKKSFAKAQKLAFTYNGIAICAEDGFIRSLGLGKEGYQPLSIVVDQSGIYFDSTQSSDLEKLILYSVTPKSDIYTRKLIQKILKVHITKYNFRYDEINPVHYENKKNILVVDQTVGDQSINYAMASADSFRQMLQQACFAHPDATIWIKIHPDVIAGKAKSHFLNKDLKVKNVQLLIGNHNPIELCHYMSEVYVVSSHLGFEALLCGKKVHCFGIPWYAGWGMTQDRHMHSIEIKARRNITCTVEQLFAAAYIDYAKYISPISHKLCELDEIIEIITANIVFQNTLPTLPLVAYGFSRWKRTFIKDYLAFPHVKLSFKYWFKPKKDQPIIAWGKKAKLLKQQGFKHVWTVEDGFLRSVGLGAKLVRPFSLVFDNVGIYYDATKPSRLEQLLNQVQLNQEQLQRIQDLIQQITQKKLTKYNIGNQVSDNNLISKSHKKIILVVGQVEDDLSIELGGIDIKTNLALIKEVRRKNPDAYIIYKSHPDVEAGLRKGKVNEKEIYSLVDYIESNKSIVKLFEYVDELHTITSLSGFEALLRKITVYCYGIPFYAGWGLTIDRHVCMRRQRILTIEELAYSVLVEYPVYNLPQTSKVQVPLVTPEHVLQYLLDLQQVAHSPVSNIRSWLFTGLRKLKIKF